MTNVHILMPVRNAASFIDASVESVLSQTHPNVTLLVHDDGSQDETPAILQALAKEYPGKVQFSQSREWAGPATTRNNLVRLSAALDPDAAFMWLDADDRFTGPKAVETVMNQMAKTGADVCLYGFEMRWEDQGAAMTSNGLGALEDKQRHEAVLQRILATPGQAVNFSTCPTLLEATSLGWTKAYAGSAKRNWAYPAEGRMYEDFPSMAMLLNAKKITAIDPQTPIVDYLRRSNSATGDRKAGHFLHDIPEQLERLLACVDKADGDKVAAATEFARAKMERYDRTLAALVDEHRNGFTSDVLDRYRTEAKRVVSRPGI